MKQTGHRLARCLVAALLTGAAAPLAAELSESGEHGFRVEHRIEVATPPEAAWRMMSPHIGEWWNPAHSWSGMASALYMDLQRLGERPAQPWILIPPPRCA